MSQMRKIVESASRVLSFVAGLCLVAMAVVVMLNIICRRIPFLGPIRGTFEVTGYLGAMVICLTLAFNQVKKGNIGVEFLVERLPQRLRAIVESCISIISAAFFLFVAWRCVLYAEELWRSGELSPTLSIPFYPLIAIIGLGCAFLGLVLFTDFQKALREAKKK